MKPTISTAKYDLYLADCVDAMRDIESVDAVITDPPYGVTENSGRRLHAYKNPDKSKGRIGWSNMAEATDYGDTRWDDSPLSTEQWSAIVSLSRLQIVFGANHLHNVLGKAGSIIVWDKKMKNDWDDFFSDCELIWCSDIRPDKVYRQLWMGALRQGEHQDRCHPTQKPIELMKWLINKYTNDGDLILDPFMGSGTTGIACMQLGRKFIGVERKQEYFDIANLRIQKAATQELLFAI